jgi:PD-(D/E)XK endonuclease
MPHPILNFKTLKQRGEWVEMRFMACAAEEGLHVSKPWGESTAYDFIVEHAQRCLRVQVKSTIMRHDNGYICHVVGSNRTPYVQGAFDFAAVYVLLSDVWFIAPQPKTSAIFLRPGVRKSKHHKYEEAWHLLRSETPSTTTDSDTPPTDDDGGDDVAPLS